MKLHFLLGGLIAVALLILAPNSQANGGGHSGGGGGHSGGNFHGGWHSGGFRGHRGGYYFHGRYFGPGFGYYGYGYPWWGWDYAYPYYGYDADYGGQYSGGDADPRFNSARAIQAALAWRGYYSGRIDGVIGPETQSAIRSFQAHEGLPVTGQVDSRLIDSLRR